MSDDVIRSLVLQRRELSWLALVSACGGSVVIVTGLRLGPPALALGALLWILAAIIVVASSWAARNHPHNFLGPGPVSTERLTISPVDRAGIVDFISLIDDDFIRRHHWGTTTVEALALLPESPLRRLATAGTGLLHQRRLPDPDQSQPGAAAISPAPIGFVSVNQSPLNESRWMIGAHLRAEHRGRGYMTEALTAALPLFAAAGITEVHLACDLDNAAMIQVATKIGMTRMADVEHWQHDAGYATPAALFVWANGDPDTASGAGGSPARRSEPGRDARATRSR